MEEAFFYHSLPPHGLQEQAPPATPLYFQRAAGTSDATLVVFRSTQSGYDLIDYVFFVIVFANFVSHRVPPYLSFDKEIKA